MKCGCPSRMKWLSAVGPIIQSCIKNTLSTLSNEPRMVHKENTAFHRQRLHAMCICFLTVFLCRG